MSFLLLLSEFELRGHRLRKRIVDSARDGVALCDRRPDLEVHVVSDAVAPRTLLDAVAEGARAGADVGAGASRPGVGVAGVR